MGWVVCPAVFADQHVLPDLAHLVRWIADRESDRRPNALPPDERYIHLPILATGQVAQGTNKQSTQSTLSAHRRYTNRALERCRSTPAVDPWWQARRSSCFYPFDGKRKDHPPADTLGMQASCRGRADLFMSA